MKCRWNWQMSFLRSSFRSCHTVQPLLFSFCYNTGMPWPGSPPLALPLEMLEQTCSQPMMDAVLLLWATVIWGLLTQHNFIKSWLICLTWKVFTAILQLQIRLKFSDLVEMPLSVWNLPDLLVPLHPCSTLLLSWISCCVLIIISGLACFPRPALQGWRIIS